MPPASPDRWISTFLQAIAAEADAARNTQLAYGRDLKDFADWAAACDLDLATLDRKAVERAVALSAEKYCSASIMIGRTAEIVREIEVVEGSGAFTTDEDPRDRFCMIDRKN